jgi:hypothetical protein
MRAAARDGICRFSYDTASMCGQWIRTLLLFDRLGVPVEQIGDSNGQMRELSEVS